MINIIICHLHQLRNQPLHLVNVKHHHQGQVSNYCKSHMQTGADLKLLQSAHAGTSATLELMFLAPPLLGLKRTARCSKVLMIKVYGDCRHRLTEVKN